MKTFFNKKGYTLVELLAVLAVLMIITALSLSVFTNLDRISNNRVDQSRILIYNKAFEDFRFTDYSTLQSTPDEQVVIMQGGKVKVNQYLNLSMEDVEALSGSGKGRYPQTKRECVAVIRAYCGTNNILPSPAVGMSYSYFYSISDGKCYVKPIDDPIASTSPLWINLNEYYTLITGYLPGDLNNDKHYTAQDLSILQQKINGSYSFNDPYLSLCCDVNQDGATNNADLIMLQKIISGIEKEPFWK